MSALEALFGLRGQVAFVTGASSGLGAEAARALAKGGADVGLVARRGELLREVAGEIEALGGRTCCAPADVTRRPELEASLARVERELGAVSIAVCAAGVAPLGRAERHPREKWDAALAVNLTAAFETSQLLGQRWIERGRGGCLIHIASVMAAGANPVHRAVGYAASKAGQQNLVRQLALEWAPHGIRVNAVAPSYFPTGMTVDPRSGDIAPEQKARMQTFTPLGRVGRPGELETAILFLAAPGSSFVTGAIVPVDGGWTAW